jgi:hypothetical protein
VDFLNNNKEFGWDTGYNFIKDALKLKNDSYFGNKNNIILGISIESEEFLNKMLLGESVFDSNLLVSKENIDSDEFDKKHSINIFKKGIWFETVYELHDYLEKIAFKFNDNLLPPSLSRLDYWYIPIQSNKIHQKLIDYYKKQKDIHDMYYIIIDEEIKCKDNRILGQKNKIELCIGFITILKKPFEIIVNEGIIGNDDVYRATVFNENHLNLEYYHWNFKQKKKSFNTQTELIKYLNELEFKFNDNTSFIPVKISKRI